MLTQVTARRHAGRQCRLERSLVDVSAELILFHRIDGVQKGERRDQGSGVGETKTRGQSQSDVAGLVIWYPDR
jgi:hypothetical protein